MAWLDVPGFIGARLRDGLPGLTVVPETDVTTPDPPVLVWSVATSHGDWWEANLTLNLVCDSSVAPRWSQSIVELVESWGTPMGPVHTVELSSTASQRSGKALHQYTFVFALSWPL